jgi:hypothetical protein
MRLQFAGVAATGLSTIGCFFGPGYLFAATLAVGVGLLAARKWDWRTVSRRALLLNLTSVYPLVLLLGILWVPFPGTVSPLAWSRAASDALPGQGGVGAVNGGWTQQLIWPASSVVRLVWALCLVTVAPFLALPRKWALCIAMFVPAFGLLIANPLAGAILVGAVPEVFWRFYLVLPVPLCFGLLVAGLIQVLPTVLRSRSAGLSAAAAAVFVAVFIAMVSTVRFSSANMGFRWKSPMA